ncbi:hypothetical protein B0H10DRAFT_2127004, partial [Mycena sp. CBHHK59/15]
MRAALSTLSPRPHRHHGHSCAATPLRFARTWASCVAAWALCQTSGVLLVYLPAAARRRVNGLSRSQPQSTPFSLILPASPILSFLRLLMLCPRAHRSPVSPLMSLALGPTKRCLTLNLFIHGPSTDMFCARWLRRLQRPTRHTDGHGHTRPVGDPPFRPALPRVKGTPSCLGATVRCFLRISASSLRRSGRIKLVGAISRLAMRQLVRLE